MKRKGYFDFKQFSVKQEDAAMKVGIDGVLLGAWANFEGCSRILDVGTGTGLIALMAAQKSDALIDAVEIDSDAATEAGLNFENSNWIDRLKVTNSSFQDYMPACQYDHIISNPPFFENSFKSKDEKRSRARHADSLTLQDLLLKSESLLSEKGRISLILNSEREERLKYLISENGLFILRFAYVAPDSNKKPHRILVELGRNVQDFTVEHFFLRDVGTNDFSEQYKRITSDFYLNLK
ncbi:tRNA1(Val) (adenine(37)-N6)-methyltransferase [Sunxiuqinia sp. A32]|uniref:tRNA1(Val) (adenine(37)-N6)-methyltransferase n=1 Tax=Sunxiuqinia sp. A32 TaxID=3461496 RepID=UPI0040465400